MNECAAYETENLWDLWDILLYGWGTYVLHIHTSFLLCLLSNEKKNTDARRVMALGCMKGPMSWFVNSGIYLKLTCYYWMRKFYEPSQGPLKGTQTHCMIIGFALYGRWQHGELQRWGGDRVVWGGGFVALFYREAEDATGEGGREREEHAARWPRVDWDAWTPSEPQGATTIAFLISL